MTLVAAVVAALASSIAAVLTGLMSRATERQKWVRQEGLHLYDEFLTLMREAMDSALTLYWTFQRLDTKADRLASAEFRATREAYCGATSALRKAGDGLELRAPNRIRDAVRTVCEAYSLFEAFVSFHPVVLSEPMSKFEESFKDLMVANELYVAAARHELGSATKRRGH